MFDSNNLLPPDSLLEHSNNLFADLSLGFRPDRGVTQGDTMATIIWVAIFDILLCWLDTSDDSTDLAYADDIFNVTNNLSSTQRKADRISSFCAFTGLQLAFVKS